jgi:hypothetical protein
MLSVLFLLFAHIELKRIELLFAVAFVFDQIELSFNQNESVLILNLLLTVGEFLFRQSLNREELVWISFDFADAVG